MKSSVAANFDHNWLTLTFKGIVTAKDMNVLYTDVRFNVSELQESYSVIFDFSECKLMYLNSLGTFKKISNYLLTNKCGEMLRVIHPRRVISKQILNYALHRPGYKPSYVATREEAEKKITSAAKRTDLRFDLKEKPITLIDGSTQHNGFILNISMGGCAVTSKTAKPVKGAEIEVRFNLSDNSKLEKFVFKARVVRVESYTFALHFLNLTSLQKGLVWGCLVAESDR